MVPSRGARRSACSQTGPLLLLLLAISTSMQLAAGSLMAIDLGSEFLKVSLIKPGRTPISVVVNEMSKRKSPALVGIVSGERLLGEEAFSFAVRYPNTVFARVRDLLGKPAHDPSIQAMLQGNLLPYKVVQHPTRGMAAMQVTEDVILSAEELVASVLGYAKQIAEAQSGAPVPDAVIAVPAYYGQAQRQALVDAADLAGINVMGLINSHTAAALQFGIERDFTNKTQHVVFYDMGSGSTEVSLVKYSSYSTKDGAGGKQVSQLEVRDVDWDAELGANNLDTLLAHHFAKAFGDKFKLNPAAVLENPRSLAKLKKQVRRTKEMLSANTAAPISVEELHDGKDFQASITREEFEQLAGSFFARAAAPLKRLLDRSGLKASDIDHVELVGGGTRVPRLQSVLSDVLGGRTLDRHLDADEAVVLGASLFAANLSTSFRLRKFGMADMNMYGVSLRIDELHQQQDTAAPAADEGKLRNLLPYLKKLPVKRIVHFANLTADPLRVSLEYNTSTPHGLLPGTKSQELAKFDITGIQTVIGRYNNSGTVNLKFEAGYDGIIKLSKAEAVVEYVVMEQKLVPIKAAGDASNSTSSNDTAAEGEATPQDSEQGSVEADESGEKDDASEPAEGAKAEAGEEQGSSDASTGTGTDKEGNATANATAPEPKFEKVMVAKKKIAKVALNVTTTWTVPPLTGEHLAAARKQVAAWISAEKAKRLNAAAKNELEAYIIRMREALHGDEGLRQVSTEQQRDQLLSALADAEDWLYMDGEHEVAAAFKEKLASLRKMGDPIETRAQEAVDRPVVMAEARKEAELKASAAGLWADLKPWISEEERTDVQNKIKTFMKWLDGREAAQVAKKAWEEPAFYVREVAAEYDKIDKAFSRVANKKKPKPPPAPEAANATEGNNTDNATGNTDEGQAPGKEEEKPSKEGNANGAGPKKEQEAKAKKEADAKAKKGKKGSKDKSEL